ncbi:hypothetical protein SODALDRAFT_157159 [Sodiomyces alkalinus F11]|uniref:Uncharacterized protein n=1 Tax=Sodiomyces alkalinus (strain CBS 110278 / VKM F-3762 / F11) TaxID=1314773 RepID=A0A3N2PXX1_SODAK|nr:hypothetical protein SODALDRAFT_157159 [Sodiomyces alkalinus F11]ROT39332.1 hypothetical protein SODALDRAFT_157159 [Sodiomyces alkalinus F11]
MSDTGAHSQDGGNGLNQTVKTPEPNPDQQLATEQLQANGPGTPGHFASFDWEEFEARYTKALVDADGHEQELMKQFDELVKYFNVWSSASSAHDSERAVKRLQTRQRFVNLSEQTMAQREQHMTEVLRAFQSALALLSQS